MEKKQLDQLISQMENYLECWKQFNKFVSLARSKKFSDEDETQFLDIKSVLTQELEMILAVVTCDQPSKEEVHALIGGTPSLKYLSEVNEATARGLENNWHKIFIGFQSILGQLKVQQKQLDADSGWGSFFKKKKG